MPTLKDLLKKVLGFNRRERSSEQKAFETWLRQIVKSDTPIVELNDNSILRHIKNGKSSRLDFLSSKETEAELKPLASLSVSEASILRRLVDPKFIFESVVPKESFNNETAYIFDGDRIRVLSADSRTRTVENVPTFPVLASQAVISATCDDLSQHSALLGKSLATFENSLFFKILKLIVEDSEPAAAAASEVGEFGDVISDLCRLFQRGFNRFIAIAPVSETETVTEVNVALAEETNGHLYMIPVFVPDLVLALNGVKYAILPIQDKTKIKLFQEKAPIINFVKVDSGNLYINLKVDIGLVISGLENPLVY